MLEDPARSVRLSLEVDSPCRSILHRRCNASHHSLAPNVKNTCTFTWVHTHMSKQSSATGKPEKRCKVTQHASRRRTFMYACTCWHTQSHWSAHIDSLVLVHSPHRSSVAAAMRACTGRLCGVALAWRSAQRGGHPSGQFGLLMPAPACLWSDASVAWWRDNTVPWPQVTSFP